MPGRQIIFKPKSTREVKKYLKPPLSQTSAVIYFTEDHKPFLLGPDGSGISTQAGFKLGEDWKLTEDKLSRILIITSVAEGK